MLSTNNIIINRCQAREIYDKALKKLCFVITGAINHKKRVLIFLSGGSSVNLYTKLAGWITSKKDIGENIAFAQVDERFQPRDQVSGIRFQGSGGKNNNNINADTIGESGLWRICDSQKIPCYLISQLGTLKESANKYNKIISKLFDSFDYKIAVLGIGEDGHTAGLLPGYEKDWNTDRYVVGYNLGQNNARALFCQHKFRQRITVTPKLLEKLDYALIIVRGERKRNAIETLLKKDDHSDLNRNPATVIQNIKEAELLTDVNR